MPLAGSCASCSDGRMRPSLRRGPRALYITNAFLQGESRLSVLAGDARLETSGFRVRQSGETEFVRARPAGALAAVGLGGCVGEIPAGPGGTGPCLRRGAVFHGLARCR